MSLKIKSWAELTGSDTNCLLLKTGEPSHLHLCQHVKIFRRAFCSWTRVSSQTAAFCLQQSALFVLHEALKSTCTPSSGGAWIIRRKGCIAPWSSRGKISRCFPGGRSGSRARRLEVPTSSSCQLSFRKGSTQRKARQVRRHKWQTWHRCKLQSEGGNTHYFISV